MITVLCEKQIAELVQLVMEICASVWGHFHHCAYGKPLICFFWNGGEELYILGVGGLLDRLLHCGTFTIFPKWLKLRT